MQVSVTSTLTGLSAVDFEEHKFIKLYILQDIKGQDTAGQKTHPVKIQGLDQKGSLTALINKKVTLTGSMESDDKGSQVFVATSVKAAA